MLLKGKLHPHRKVLPVGAVPFFVLLTGFVIDTLPGIVTDNFVIEVSGSDEADLF